MLEGKVSCESEMLKMSQPNVCKYLDQQSFIFTLSRSSVTSAEVPDSFTVSAVDVTIKTLKRFREAEDFSWSQCQVKIKSYQNRPVLCNWTRGWKTASSSFRCRHSSSSYSAIVLSNSSNISSAAAVSRCFTTTLSVWTLDIFTDSHELSLQKHSVKNCLLTLMCLQSARLRILPANKLS